MSRRLRRVLLWMIGLNVACWTIGQILTRRLSTGDEGSDEFRIAVVFGGRKFQSRAQRLRTGSVIASMGGVDLDLRGATLDPGGATLDVNATMGGVQIIVPIGWAVDLERHAVAGGVDARVAGRDTLPEDAPILRVRAVARMGGALVTTDANH
jgi:Cell wall-active antibiotics response 4TMS YvqF